MKKLCIATSIFLLFLLVSLCANAQTDSVSIQDKIPAHPRLLLLRGEENAINAELQSESYLRIHKIILLACDQMLNEPPCKRELIGKRLLATCRECLRRIFFLSYAWRTTHKTEYLKRAEAELLAVCNFSDWNYTQHFLDVAEMTMAVSIGYDWLYNDLSQQSRNVIKRAILEKGLEPSLNKKYNDWMYRTNNWNQVCNAGMAYGAMAIYEDNPQLATFIINRSINSIKISMKDEYAPDGAFPEGYGYWAYGTSFNVMFVDAIEKIFGKDYGLSQMEGFLKTPYYMENLMGSSWKTFNYSDAGSGWEPQPAMAWFAEKLKDPSLLWIERAEINNNRNTGALMKERLLPAFMIWGNGTDPDRASAPTSNIYVGGGVNPVAMMRTSWTNPNAIFVGLKAGTPNESHAHMDIGSFVMDADGVRWAMDLGMQDYVGLEAKGIDLWHYRQNSQRWQIYRYNNFHHNTLSVNNDLQYFDSKAAITSHSNMTSFMNATTDLSDVYKNGLLKAKRGVAIIDNAFVAVRDEVETGDKKATIQWTMVTPAVVNIKEKNKVELAKDGKKLTLLVTEPAEVNVLTWPANPTHSYDSPNPNISIISFKVKVPANTKQSINVLLLPGKTVKTYSKENIKPLAEWPK